VVGKLSVQDPQNLHASPVFEAVTESINNDEIGRTHRTYVEMKKNHKLFAGTSKGTNCKIWIWMEE
jgi:hypothetical protein